MCNVKFNNISNENLIEIWIFNWRVYDVYFPSWEILVRIYNILLKYNFQHVIGEVKQEVVAFLYRLSVSLSV